MTRPKPEDLTGEGGILKQLTKALVERCLNAEMDIHLDDPKYKSERKAKHGRRNGHAQKTLKGEFGQTVINDWKICTGWKSQPR